MLIDNNSKKLELILDKKATIISHYIKRTPEGTLEKDTKNQNLGFLSASKKMEK